LTVPFVPALASPALYRLSASQPFSYTRSCNPRSHHREPRAFVSIHYCACCQILRGRFGGKRQARLMTSASTLIWMGFSSNDGSQTAGLSPCLLGVTNRSPVCTNHCSKESHSIIFLGSFGVSHVQCSLRHVCNVIILYDISIVSTSSLLYLDSTALLSNYPMSCPEK
jgi:hypothetical protein